jgi:ribosomal protein S18 acetylase RimI-like enzyme
LNDTLQIRPFRPDDESAVVTLWQTCNLVRPWNAPSKDIARKMRHQPELFLVGVIDGRIVATVMAGYEGHRGWINYLAIAPDLRGGGHGRAMMDAAEAGLRRLGCPKINLQVRRSNRDVIAFYAALGYAEDDVISLGKRLETDDGAR